MDLLFEKNSIKINSEQIKSRLPKSTIVKQSVYPFYLAKIWKSRGKSIQNTSINANKSFLTPTPFDQIGVDSNDFYTKLSTLVCNRFQELSIDNNNIALTGKFKIRNNEFADFSNQFNGVEQFKQYCTFIDDLHFLKETVGHTLKCNLSRNGILKFYNKDRKQITPDNLNVQLNSILNDYKNKLNILVTDTRSIENTVNKLETQIFIKQESNEQLLSQIEKFSLSTNNLFNALKYYFVQKDNSIYNILISILKISQNNLKDNVIADVLSSNSESTQNGNNKLKKFIGLQLARQINENSEIKSEISQIAKLLFEEQSYKRKLAQKYNTLKKSCKIVMNNEETFKYVYQKIKENSTSVFSIMKYRRQIIKDLKIYGLKVASV